MLENGKLIYSMEMEFICFLQENDIQDNFLKGRNLETVCISIRMETTMKGNGEKI